MTTTTKQEAMSPLLRNWIEGYLSVAEAGAANARVASTVDFCRGQATALRDLLRYADEVLS